MENNKANGEKMSKTNLSIQLDRETTKAAIEKMIQVLIHGNMNSTLELTITTDGLRSGTTFTSREAFAVYELLVAAQEATEKKNLIEAAEQAALYPSKGHAFPCDDTNCIEAVKFNVATRRWFITCGHRGFNSATNNRNGYVSIESAKAAHKSFYRADR